MHKQLENRNEIQKLPAFFRNSEKGQTLIETMAAVFILVMGITAAVGLAIYAFSTSTNVTKQIIANGLAREGIEAIKTMRDTNWLKAALATNCYNYQFGTSDASCYPAWLTSKYDIDPGAGLNGTTFILQPDPTNPDFWVPAKLAVGDYKFGLNMNTNVQSAGFKGFYYHPSPAVQDGDSAYYRKIVLKEDATQPYNTNVGPKLIVKSQVWWTDKKCPRVKDYDLANNTCRLELTMFLTNWKNY